MTVGIIVAMDKERDLIVQLLQQRSERIVAGRSCVEGMLGRHRVVLLMSGIGKVAAAVGAAELIRSYCPDCIVNTGVAGALDTSVGVADVVAAERTVYHDVDCGTDNPYGRVQGFPLYYEADRRLLDVFRALNLGATAHIGLVCSGDKFVSQKADLLAIKSHFPEGLATDMESCAIAQTCHMYDVPFLSLRIVSDTPGVNDHYVQYFDFWKIAPERSFTVLSRLLDNL